MFLCISCRQEFANRSEVTTATRHKTAAYKYHCHPCHQAIQQRYMNSPKGRAYAIRNKQRQALAKKTAKGRARDKLQKAVAAGTILRPTVCLHGCEGRIEGHHPDYSKPLEVLWLCKSHHEAVHHPSLLE